MDELNECIFWLKWWLKKNIILFRIKLVLIYEKDFDNEPVYNKEYFKNTETKSHGKEVTDFYDKQVPKVDSNHTCLAVMSLEFVLKKDENYYPQVYLKECKYTEEKFRHSHGNLLISLMKNRYFW